jgi:YihY family inner membrane protein
MSSATRVPETRELTGDDARRTLLTHGRVRLLEDALARFRAADGTSHARSLAFMVSLVLVQGLIVIVGLSALVGSTGLTRTVSNTIGSAVPGPATGLLESALRQAGRVAHRRQYLPLVLGLGGLVFTATTALGQVERGLNRIYGIEKDRPFAEKYKRAFLLALTVGTLFAMAFVLLGLGRGAGSSWGHEARTVWFVLRWPVSLLLVALGFQILLEWSPNRRQPSRSWLAFASLTAVLLWALTTIGLALCFRLASTFPKTYGPLAGTLALLFWTFASSVAIFFGVAVAAQLEAVRAGIAPREPAGQEARRSRQAVSRS